MKTICNAILVVEGKSDVAFVNSFLDCEIVPTNGTAIPRETIEYLSKAIQYREIIVLSDPDYPGLSIRKTLDELIPNLRHAFIRKEVSIKGNKVGVAESTKDEILNSIKAIPVNRSGEHGCITMHDLYRLCLVGFPESKLKRKAVSEYFHLGYVNAKTFIKRVNQFNISYNEIEECINEYQAIL